MKPAQANNHVLTVVFLSLYLVVIVFGVTQFLICQPGSGELCHFSLLGPVLPILYVFVPLAQWLPTPDFVARMSISWVGLIYFLNLIILVWLGEGLEKFLRRLLTKNSK